ncbi:MAG: GGDEF domain-containing protein [Pseudoflavonifractor sp.]|nr:GGDEF domain-containing protein [Pseudoflavonifractor sp.]
MDENKFNGIFDIWPLPAILVDIQTSRIVGINQMASQLGFFDAALSDIVEQEGVAKTWLAAGGTPINHQANIMVNGRVQVASVTVRRIWLDKQDMQLIVITSVKEPGQGRNDTLSALCEIYANDQKNALRSFLQASAMDVGAFSAAVYEKRKERYIIRDEWRSRRSVCVSILSSDFEVHPEQEMARIGQIKRAAGLGYAHFIKSYGTQGLLIYFFDHSVEPAIQPLIEKFARLLRALAPDVPRHSSTAVIRQALDALQQGVAIWDKTTKKLLYENKAYHALFGGSIPFSEDRHGIGPTAHVDSAGRRYNLAHTITRMGGQRLVITHAADVTRYILAEQKLAMTAKTDPLTGLYNRRAGLEILEEIYSINRKARRPLTVGFADIDGLKGINDTYGHGAGDAMIRSAADVLKKHVGKNGTVCRLGGDEFVLILPDTNQVQAALIGEQIKNGVKRCFVGNTRSISISFGFKQAEYKADETAASLVSVADQDMYRDKRDKSAD